MSLSAAFTPPMPAVAPRDDPAPAPAPKPDDRAALVAERDGLLTKVRRGEGDQAAASRIHEIALALKGA